MIELRKITEDNFMECIGLQISDEQKGFVASNIKSLAQAKLAHDNQDWKITVPGSESEFVKNAYRETAVTLRFDSIKS